MLDARTGADHLVTPDLRLRQRPWRGRGHLRRKRGRRGLVRPPSAVCSNTSGGQASSRKPGSANFLAWWDADTLRELLDGNHVDKYGTGGDTRLLTADGTTSNNGTKSTPALSGDIFGDWREEVVLRTTGNNALRIYTTTNVATNRIYTLLHDPQYRVAIAWQNTAYNQPPHPSFFIGDGMSDAADAEHRDRRAERRRIRSRERRSYQLETASLGGGTVSESTNGGFIGSGYANFSATGGFAQMNNADGRGGGSHAIRDPLCARRDRESYGTRAGERRRAEHHVQSHRRLDHVGDAERDVHVQQRHGEHHPVRIERTGPGERRPDRDPLRGYREEMGTFLI